MDAPTNSIFSGPITHPLSMLRVLIKKSFHMPVRKKKGGGGGLRVSDFAFSFVVFKWSFSSDIVAVKWLIKFA